MNLISVVELTITSNITQDHLSLPETRCEDISSSKAFLPTLKGYFSSP